MPVYPLFDLTHLPVFLSNLPPDLLHELVLFLFLASLLNRPLGSASTDLPDSSTATAPVLLKAATEEMKTFSSLLSRIYLLGAGLPREKARRAAKAVCARDEWSGLDWFGLVWFGFILFRFFVLFCLV